MDKWSILKIERTTDKSVIKKAYREALKVTRPDDDESAFIELRAAYEEALTYAENYEEDLYDEEYEEDLYDVEYDEDLYDVEYDEDLFDEDEDSFSEEEYKKFLHWQALNEWEKQVAEAINDIEKVRDANFWRKFLYEGISYKLKYYEDCKRIIQLQFLKAQRAFLPDEVWKELDDFFGLKPQGIAPTLKDENEYRLLEKVIALNEMIDFQMFISDENNNIQWFCQQYERLIFLLRDIEKSSNEITKLISSLDGYGVTYIPFECIKIAYNFYDVSEEIIYEQINHIINKYGKSIYTELLQAEYYIYVKKHREAIEILLKLYKDVSLKNYPMIYQMAVCFKKVSMYYESYMLVKQLTWLKPQEFMYDMAQELYEDMKNEYDRRIASDDIIEDIEHIRMSRLYLRTYLVRKRAHKLLDKVTCLDDNLWEYNVARILCLLCEGEVERAEECFKILKNYDKSKLSTLDVLEYEELKLRYLLMQGKYSECMEECDKFLDEYPMAYSIIMIKSYADYADYDNKHYSGFNWLYDIMPQRVEAALPLMEQGGKNNAHHFINTHKEECVVEDRYYTALKLQGSDNIKYTTELIELCKYIRDNEVCMDDRSSLLFLDLHKIYQQTLLAIHNYLYYECQDEDNHYRVLENMKNSKYNNPDKYIDLKELYFKEGSYDKLIKLLMDDEKDKLLNTNNQYNMDNIGYLISYYHGVNDLAKIKELESKIDMSQLDSASRYDIHGYLYFAYYNMRELEAAEKHIKQRIENDCKRVWDYNQLIKVYVQKNEKKYLKKAISVYKECISIFGKVGDINYIWTIHESASKAYALLGDMKNVKKCLDNILIYSKSEKNKLAYNCYMAEAYECIGEYEKAYDALLQYEKDDPTAATVSVKKWRVLFKLGRFDELYSFYLKSLDEDEDDDVEYNKELLSYIIHALYLKNSYVDVDLLKRYYEEISIAIDTVEKAKNGTNYIIMAEFSMLLDKKEEYEYYSKLAKEFQWHDFDLKRKFLDRFEIWKLIYQGKWNEAYEYFDKMDIDEVNSFFELSGLHGYLEDKLKK